MFPYRIQGAFKIRPILGVPQIDAKNLAGNFFEGFSPKCHAFSGGAGNIIYPQTLSKGKGSFRGKKRPSKKTICLFRVFVGQVGLCDTSK